MPKDEAEKVSKAYRKLSSIPSLLSARLLQEGSVVTSVWSQRNLERGASTKFMKNYLLTSDLQKSSETGPVEVSNELLSSYSPSEKYRAVIKDDDAKPHKQFLEIWSQSNLERILDLSAVDLHGDVYTDVEFGALRWSADETKILYVAEQKVTKSDSYVKQSYCTSDDEKKDEDNLKGQDFVFKQDWGEQLVKKKQSVIIVYDLTTQTFKLIKGIPHGVCPAQPIWAPDGSYIVGIAYSTLPRKLGLIYCTNRPSSIFILDFYQGYADISDKNKAVKSPVFTPDGKTLLWLQRDSKGPHNSCMELVKMNCPLMKTKIVETVIGIVYTERIIHGGYKFYGIYSSTFPKRCWASDRRLVFSTCQKTTTNTYIVDIDDWKVTQLELGEGSQVVLDVADDRILISKKHYFIPDVLAVARVPVKGQENTIVFENITESNKLDHFENFSCNVMDLKYNKNFEIDNFTAICISPKTGADKEFPLIVWPHGGPHSSFANMFSLEIALFAYFGFPILLVNYRGSVGAGEETVKFLLGKIGDSDVSDCHFAAIQAIKTFPWLDQGRVGLMGGSHGGFLVTHLSGQYPKFYKAVVARNPVVDVAIQSITSDIPDWSFVECGFTYTQDGPLKDDEFLKMRRASPIVHAHNVRAPTLLQVGLKDLRVTPYQASEYYHRLNVQHVVVEMNTYDDNHPLGSVPNELNNIITSLLWMQKYLNKK